MTQLRLSKDLVLPVDAATQTFLNVGKRGSGKSTTAARLVEQLLKAKVPVVILDPVDTWWGLKAQRDGGPGHDIYVFGGRHQDLPLEAHGGALIADVVCEHRVPMVLSCKHLSGAERSRFMVAFAQTLYQKWGGGVLHLVLEEAHELAPQAPPKGEAAEQMLGAFKRLWKLGRSQGIGGTAITQRPASLHKDITTQSEILVVHRTIGPQDVEAVRQWIKYHNQGDEILGELATLKTGEAFVWTPEFPEDAPIGLRRVQILPRETFDSSATPKFGEQRAEPKALAHADLERLRSKMAATIERAKAEDPKELRARIRQLEQDLRKKDAVLAEVDVRTKRIDESLDRVKAQQPREVAVVKDAQVKRIEALALRLEAEGIRVRERLEALDAQRDRLAQAQQAIIGELANLRVELAAARREGEPVAPPRPAPARPSDGRQQALRPFRQTEPSQRAAAHDAKPGNGDARLGKAERAILAVLAQQHVDGCEAGKLTLLAGYRWTGGFRNSLSMLRSAGLIVGENSAVMRITQGGLDALGDYDQMPAPGPELQRYWLQHPSFGKCEREVLSALLAHRGGLGAAELTHKTGYEWSGGFRNSLSNLRTAGVLVGRNSETMRASEELFA